VIKFLRLWKTITKFNILSSLGSGYKDAILWNVTACSLKEFYQCLGGTSSPGLKDGPQKQNALKIS
jgi:hypothetical protein